MAKLSLEGMDFHAYHGVYEEENILGGKYTVDVYLEIDIVKAAVTDDVQATVNYEVVYAIVKTAMAKPAFGEFGGGKSILEGYLYVHSLEIKLNQPK